MSKIKAYIFIFLSSSLSASYLPSNFNRPYDVNYILDNWPKDEGRYKKFRIANVVEFGSTEKSFDDNNKHVGVLQLYDNSEATIPMLLNAQNCCAQELAKNIAISISPATDDGFRGHIKLDANYSELQYNFSPQYNFWIPGLPGDFELSLYVPFVSKKFSNLEWCDLTQSVHEADSIVKSELTQNTVSLLKNFGDLSLNNTSQSGIGDTTFMLRWWGDFIQQRKYLQNVRLTGRLGLSLPTGKKRNIDEILSVPLGNDGAVGIPASIAMDLFFLNNFKFGVEFEALKLFDTTSEYRMKTDKNQTELFLLSKGEARKKYGVFWKFNLYLEAKHFARGLSAKLAYQYQKQDEDHLYPKTNCFNENIVNSAKALEGYNFHNMLFGFSYDFFREAQDWYIKPQLLFFYKLPITGKQVISADTFGVDLTLTF